MFLIPIYVDEYHFQVTMTDSIVTAEGITFLDSLTMTGDSSVFRAAPGPPLYIIDITWYGGAFDLNGNYLAYPTIDGPAVKSILSDLIVYGLGNWYAGSIYIPEGLTFTITNSFDCHDGVGFIGNGTLVINSTHPSYSYFFGFYLTFPKYLVVVNGSFLVTYPTTQNAVIISSTTFYMQIWTSLGETYFGSRVQLEVTGTIDNFGNFTFSSSDYNFYSPPYASYTKATNHEGATMTFASMETAYFPLTITNYGHIHIASSLSFFSILHYGLITVGPSVTVQAYHEYSVILDDPESHYGGLDYFTGIGIVCMGEPYGVITLDPLATLAISPTMTGPWNMSCSIEGGTVALTGYSQLFGGCNVDTMYLLHPFHPSLLSYFFLW